MDTAHQVSLSFTISLSLPKLMSVDLVMPSNHLILFCPLLPLVSIFPNIRDFPMGCFFTSGGNSSSVGNSSSASAPSMNIQGWLPLELIVLIFLLSKEQASFHFMATVTICSVFGTQKIKISEDGFLNKFFR